MEYYIDQMTAPGRVANAGSSDHIFHHIRARSQSNVFHFVANVFALTVKLSSTRQRRLFIPKGK